MSSMWSAIRPAIRPAIGPAIGPAINRFRHRRIAGDAAWVISGQIISAVLALVSMRLMTEYVPPSVFGSVVLVVGVVALICAIGCMPAVAAGERLYPQLALEGRLAILRKVLAQRILMAAALGCVLLVVAAALLPPSGSVGPWAVLVAALLLVVTARRELETHWYAAARDHRRSGLWAATDTLARPLVAVAFVIIMNPTPAVVLLAFVVATGINNSLWARGSKPTATGVQSESAARALSARMLSTRVGCYARPLVVVNLLEWFNGQGDRFIIAALLTTSEVGLYGATYVLVHEALRRIANVLARTLRPVYFQLTGYDDDRARIIYAAWLSAVAGVGATGVAVLYVAHDAIATLLLAPGYRSASALMPIIAAGSVLSVLRGVVQQPLLASEDTNRLVLPKLLAVACAVVTIPLLTMTFGLLGTALASPIYFAVELAAMTAIVKPWRHLPSWSAISGSVVAMARS